MVLAHEADVAFGGRPPRDDRIEADAFRDNELVLIAAPDDPLAGAGPVDGRGAGRPHVAAARAGLGDARRQRGVPGRGRARRADADVGSNGAIKQAARAGLGISFVSRDAVASELEAGLLGVIEVDPAPAPRDWHLIRSAVGPARAIVDEFLPS